jgi:hypothetical protein
MFSFRSTQIGDHQQSWECEDRSWKEPGHLYQWPLIFNRIFLISVLAYLSVFDDHLTDSSSAVSCSLQSVLVLVVQLTYTIKQ